MADSNAITLIASDLQALADRLFARGSSRLRSNQPDAAGDMRLAAGVIRALVPALAPGETIVVDPDGGGFRHAPAATAGEQG